MDKGVSSYEHVNKSDSSQSVEGRHVIRITIQGKPLGVGIFKDKEGKYCVGCGRTIKQITDFGRRA